MFEGWHDYYLTIGGAAGALIGLHFTVALMLSGVALTPRLDSGAVSLLVGAAAFVGLGPNALHRRSTDRTGSGAGGIDS